MTFISYHYLQVTAPYLEQNQCTRSLVGTNTCQIFAGSYLSLGLAQAGSEFLAFDISPPLSIPLSSLRAFLSDHSFSSF